MNQSIDERYALTWPCGGADHWTVATIAGEPMIEFVGDVGELHLKTYNPLSRPDLCEDLAALGATAWKRGVRIGGDGLTAMLETAANDPAIQDQTLAFVKTYGPPARASGAEGILVPLWRRAHLIVELLVEAIEVDHVLRLAQMKRGRTASDREAILERRLSNALYHGVRHTVRFSKEGLVIEHAAVDLISAAWLQLAEALAPGGKGFRVCKDPACGQVFAVRHKNEKYHSDRCRNRHAVELYRARRRKELE